MATGKALLGLVTVAGGLLLARSMLRSQSPNPRAVLAQPLVQRPTELPVASPGKSGTTRRFDALFAKYSRGMPVAYLRALARGESGMNPLLIDRKGARGLLQVVQVVREDFNDRHQTKYTREDLLDAEINVMMATETLRRIIDAYKRFHPRVPNLQENWSNPRFVELLTFGWNAGYSEPGGLGRVARMLESCHITEITADLIHGNADAAGASKHLSNPSRLAWSKGVARRYFQEQARDDAERAQQPVA